MEQHEQGTTEEGGAPGDEKKERARPIHVVRIGPLRAAIWANRVASGVIHNVTVSRSFRVGEEWRESSSFGVDDLLCLAKALDLAHTWILGHRKAPSPADTVQF
jgi:hypothetical protein